MKLKINEFKNKALIGVEGLIDIYFAGNSINERFINATIKIIANQNIDKLDNIINLFADSNGYIDTDLMIKEYGKAFGTDKIILDLRDYVNNDMVKRALPNKALVIKIDDIASIFEST
jgi:hypothetical protein